MRNTLATYPHGYADKAERLIRRADDAADRGDYAQAYLDVGKAQVYATLAQVAK